MKTTKPQKQPKCVGCPSRKAKPRKIGRSKEAAMLCDDCFLILVDAADACRADSGLPSRKLKPNWKKLAASKFFKKLWKEKIACDGELLFRIIEKAKSPNEVSRLIDDEIESLERVKLEFNVIAGEHCFGR